MQKKSYSKLRKKIMRDCRRIVIKAGTRLLTNPKAIPSLIEQIAFLRATGKQVIFVSSGAVGTAMRMLKLKKRPTHLSEVQALAAMGQVELMSIYNKECLKHGFRAAQLLLTADDLRSRERHLNVENCIESLLAHNILPILNENDPVSVDELKFGDNDSLASLLGSMTRSDLTVILTTVDGLLQPNPDGTLGERIPLICGLTEDQLKMAKDTDDANLSIGGMKSKLKAAQVLNSAGETLWIVDGQSERILEKMYAGEDVGTIFLPPENTPKMEAKKRWINTFSKISGTLTVDDGAAAAVCKKHGSLLPAGILEVNGSFKRGDIVEIITKGGKTIARGQTNYSSEETRKIKGKKSTDIRTIIGYNGEDEVVHRNNMVVS